jgi:hypothetical protein
MPLDSKYLQLGQSQAGAPAGKLAGNVVAQGAVVFGPSFSFIR